MRNLGAKPKGDSSSEGTSPSSMSPTMSSYSAAAAAASFVPMPHIYSREDLFSLFVPSQFPPAFLDISDPLVFSRDPLPPANHYPMSEEEKVGGLVLFLVERGESIPWLKGLLDSQTLSPVF